MKTFPFQPRRAWPLALAALLALSACGTMSTVDRRSREKAAVYNAATPAQQKLMRERWIGPGFTPDMVYIALDSPDKIVVTRDGGSTVWIYYFMGGGGRAFEGGVKLTSTIGSSLPGGGLPAGAVANPVAGSGSMGKYTTYGLAPDLSAAQPSVQAIPRLFVLFRQGKVVTCKYTQE
jgi:hypothetical protein